MPAGDAKALGDWFHEQADSGSLVDYLKTFAVTTSVMQTAPALTRIAREYVLDLVADGIVYGEVRWAPEQHLERGLSLDGAEPSNIRAVTLASRCPLRTRYRGMPGPGSSCWR